MLDNTAPYIGHYAFHHRTRYELGHWSNHNTHINWDFLRSCVISTVRLTRKVDYYARKRCDK